MKKYLAFLTVLSLVVLSLMVVSAQDDMEEMELPPAVQFMLDSFTGDFENYEEYVHPDWQWVGNGGVAFEGHEGYVGGFTFWTTAFPDLEYELLHVIGDGDAWALGIRVVATNSGGFEPMGIEATGAPLDFYTYGFIYLEDDMLYYCDWTWDWITWYDALGVPYSSEPADE